MKLKLLFIFATFFIIYIVSSPGKTYYDYFTRLATSFVNLKLYIDEKPTWLNELIPFGGKYYVALPPMPAVLMAPLVVVFNKHFSETYFSIVLGIINAMLLFKALKALGFSGENAIFTTTFFALGTNHWFLSSVGSSWYIAHITAIFFLLLALLETFTKKRLFWIGIYLGCAFWSRTSTLFTLPFFYLYLHNKIWPLKLYKNFFLLNLGVFVFILIDALYNYLRFGDFNPFAPYNLIQGYDANTVVNGVYMSINYLPRHLEALFLHVPQFIDKPPFLIPSLYSLPLWFTSPALFYIFKAKKSLLAISCWSAVIPTLFVVMQWAGVGISQFGYRFALDFIPFLLILVAIGLGQKPSKIAYLLLILSILVNAWGVILINKFNLWVI